MQTELSNPPPPTPMLNSGQQFTQYIDNISATPLSQYPTGHHSANNAARQSSSFGSLSESAISSGVLNVRPALSSSLVKSFQGQSDQLSYMNPSKPVDDQIQKYSHLPAFSSSMRQEVSRLPKSKSFTKIYEKEQRNWVTITYYNLIGLL